MSSLYKYQTPQGFREIPGFSRYAVNEVGEVFSKLTGRVLTVSPNAANGYLDVSLQRDGDRKPLRCKHHRIVAMAFVPCPDDTFTLQVNHINGIKDDNRPCNLEWVTCQQNVHHAWDNGMQPDRIAISVRNVDTGEVRKYPSVWTLAKECAASMIRPSTTSSTRRSRYELLVGIFAYGQNGDNTVVVIVMHHGQLFMNKIVFFPIRHQ